MDDLEEVALTNRIKSGRRRLIAGGIIQVIGGILGALVVALTLLSFLISGNIADEQDGRFVYSSMVFGLFIEVAITAWLLTMGLGSMSMKRWARTLTLAVLWPGFILGTYMITMSFLYIPEMVQAYSTFQDASVEVPPVFIYFGLGLMSFGYIAFPGLLLLLYAGKRTREACEYHQPLPGWTDSIPLPVLATCFLFSFQTLGSLPMMISVSAFPLFGVLIKGTPGIFLIIVLVLLFAVIVWGFCRLQPIAWWAALALGLFVSGSSSLTFFQMDMTEMMDLFLGASAQEIEMPQLDGIMDSPAVKIQALGYPLLLLAFFLYTKRFFKNNEEAAQPPETTDELQ